MASEERKNILVITLSNIGDVVLTTPVIGTLRSAFPQGHFTVVVGPKAADLLRGSRMIDRLLIYDKHWRLGEKLKLVRTLREEFYDCVVDLRNSALPFLVRANRRSPIFRKPRAILARAVHLEVLQRMRFKNQPPAPFDFFSAENEKALLGKIGQENSPVVTVVVAPGAGSEAKRWPVERFRKVMTNLLMKIPAKIFVVGDSQEASLGEALSSVDPKHVINLCGKISLREFAALVSRAELVLANDSACMHLAYELDRPVVALFGPSDSERYGREGKKWRIVKASPPRTLQELPAEKVFEACESLLNHKAEKAVS